MADPHDYLALDWVREEIRETLNQAQQTLESYVENPADSSRMRFCQTYLHQVHGTLRIVEFYGAGLLAEEMEKLASALLEGDVANVTDAHETLMGAILQLPPYLERVQTGRRDLPLVLLPLLNDLRAARGDTLLTETSLFSPDMSSLADHDHESPVIDKGEFHDLVKKLRQMYQIALLGVLQGKETDKNYGYMLRVFARLEKISGRSPKSPLWDIVAAVVEGLSSNGISLSVAVKMILGQVDRELKQLVRDGADSLAQLPTTELLKNLLYYVGRSDSQTPRVEEIRHRFHLEEALPSEELVSAERERMTGPDQAAMGSVINALSEELGKVKSALERHIQTDANDTDALADQVIGLKQIADTLAVLGMGQQREQVQAQSQLLDDLVAGRNNKVEEGLATIADSLLQVESSLAVMADNNRRHLTLDGTPDGMMQAGNAVLRESHAGLEDAKGGIVEYIASQWDRSHLHNVPAQLNSVRGALELVKLIYPAEILKQCVSYVETELLPESASTPDWKSMDTLADAITSVEYYLERLADDPGTRDDILRIAKESLSQLGYGLSDEVLQQAQEHQQTPPQVEDEDAADHLEVEEIEVEGLDEDIFAEGELTLEQEETVAVETVTEVDDDDLIDDEIIEIFVEEADEVLEALNEYFPRWAENTSDEEALTEFRRAFHTLKGSGRMVGAMAVGELAWSVENMMNRVIDKTIEPTNILIELVRKVHGLIPQLVGDFSRRQPPSIDTQPLIHAADTLADGGQIDAIPEVGDAEPTTKTEPQLGAEPEAENELELETEFDADADVTLEDIEIDMAAPLQDDADELLLEEPVTSAGEEETLLDIFIGEAHNNLKELKDWLDEQDRDLNRFPVHDLVHRCLHTLKGSAKMAEVGAIADIAEPAEKCIKEMINMRVPADRELLQMLGRIHDMIASALVKLEQGEPVAQRLEGAGELIGYFEYRREQIGNDGGGVDRRLLSVFLSEGMDIILDAENLLERWAQDPSHMAEIDELNTELHLLAGSAKTAGLIEVHHMAAKLSACYARLAGHEKEADDAFLALARDGQEALINMMDYLAAGQTLDARTDILEQLDEWQDAQQSESTSPDANAITDDEDTGTTINLDSLPEPELDEDEDDPDLVEDDLPEIDNTVNAETDSDVVGDWLEDEELGDIFLEEAEDVLSQAQQALDAWFESNNKESVVELQRHLHTLKGGARMAGVGHVGDLAHELEFLYEDFGQAAQQQPDASLKTLLQACHDRLAQMVDQLKQGESVFAAIDLLQAIRAERGEADSTRAMNGDLAAEADPVTETHLDLLKQDTFNEAQGDATPSANELTEQPEISQGPPANHATGELSGDPELVAIFLEEAEEILESADTSLESWLEATDNLVEVQALQRDLHTLKGGARMAEVEELGNLSHELENLYEGLGLGNLKPNNALFKLLYRCHDRLNEMVSNIKTGSPLREATGLISQIHAYLANPDDFVLPAADDKVEMPTADAAESDDASHSHIDKEILAIFLEESHELGERLDKTFLAWLKAPEKRDQVDEIKRILHTLKGGARLAGLTELGDLSHKAESLIETTGHNVDDTFFLGLQEYVDKITKRIDKMHDAAMAEPEHTSGTPAQSGTSDKDPVASVPATASQQAPAVKKPRKKKSKKAQPQEMVRIGADVLESLVNLAGETSISRGRIEQGVGEFASSITEMDNTVERLYGQLRRLDIETEAQIMSNYQQGVEAGEYDEDFDPLEMDQYSELHQITKQLSESAYDLLDLKTTLIDRARDTETLLLQQSRVNTELQEKLMRTRMVPFSRLVPRLRRIVRQISGELDKQVDFGVVNPEGELDRTLMERIVAPLEHMLRNAVDHGIEEAAARAKAGKPEKGNVKLELGRDGGDVLLVLSDDGGGINTQAVRNKAIEKGLLDPNADDLTEREIQQFIFSAGFSTAEEVTQISGRGVGMDVVASDIKQLGGSVSIESEEGVGTRFVVRLPFTLAMNRALLVSARDDAYAIPLTQVEGIVRVSPFELEAYLDDGTENYTYAGQEYELDYLGRYVHNVERPRLDGLTSPLPVLLLHSQEHQVALVVDSLIGSREIVVKSVGPQLSTVAGINGATILGDGSVVIILDIHSLIRTSHLERRAAETSGALPEPVEPLPQEPQESAGPPLIMVTDDSVTVRKVTGRLLERNGFEVMTAKDGMDAVAKLEEQRPDLMLLDIEMPRMDGFEVASHMRHDERFLDVPIVMITSRTGEKHRERAKEIGVNEYLGKPFQEGELLSTIRELLKLEA